MAACSHDVAAEVTIEIEGSVDGISHQPPTVVGHVTDHEAAANADGGEGLNPNSLMNSIRRKLIDEPRQIKASYKSCSIYKIPPNFRHLDKENYVPQIISIGPFHYAKRMGDLQAMEKHKWRYLEAFLHRSGGPGLERCLETIKRLEQRARECYSEYIDLNSDSFVEMMVLDACFIIELLFRINRRHGLYKEDPVLNVASFPTIMTDLIMLENQIPFFILEDLFDLMNGRDASLVEMTYKFFESLSTIRHMLSGCDVNGPINHLLHLLQLSCLPSSKNDYPRSNFEGTIACTSELQKAGIKFKKRDACGFLQVDYHDEEIEIPPIYFSQMSQPLFLNLVAFEQFHLYQSPYITSYISFMDYLIKSAKDVKILSQKGITVKESLTDKEVAGVFNKISKGSWVLPKRDYLGNVCERISRSTGRVWPRFRTILMRDYFNSPWAFMSFLAALLLLFLTLSQSFFSAFPKFALEN